MDSRIDTALLIATVKTTFTKTLQKRRKELWMERSEEVKNNPTYSNHYCKIFSRQSLTFFSIFVKFLLFINFFFSREKFISIIVVNFFKVPGRSIEGILISTLLYIFYTLFFVVKEIQTVFLDNKWKRNKVVKSIYFCVEWLWLQELPWLCSVLL